MLFFYLCYVFFFPSRSAPLPCSLPSSDPVGPCDCTSFLPDPRSHLRQFFSCTPACPLPGVSSFFSLSFLSRPFFFRASPLEIYCDPRSSHATMIDDCIGSPTVCRPLSDQSCLPANKFQILPSGIIQPAPNTAPTWFLVGFPSAEDYFYFLLYVYFYSF